MRLNTYPPLIIARAPFVLSLINGQFPRRDLFTIAANRGGGGGGRYVSRNPFPLRFARDHCLSTYSFPVNPPILAGRSVLPIRKLVLLTGNTCKTQNIGFQPRIISGFTVHAPSRTLPQQFRGEDTLQPRRFNFLTIVLTRNWRKISKRRHPSCPKLVPNLSLQRTAFASFIKTYVRKRYVNEGESDKKILLPSRSTFGRITALPACTWLETRRLSLGQFILEGDRKYEFGSAPLISARIRNERETFVEVIGPLFLSGWQAWPRVARAPLITTTACLPVVKPCYM